MSQTIVILISIYLSTHLPVCLSVCLSINLSFYCSLSISLSLFLLYLFVFMSSIPLFIHLSIYLLPSLSLTLYLSIHLYVFYPSTHLPTYLFRNLFISCIRHLTHRDTPVVLTYSGVSPRTNTFYFEEPTETCSPFSCSVVFTPQTLSLDVSKFWIIRPAP